jgi:hypothetical protein
VRVIGRVCPSRADGAASLEIRAGGLPLLNRPVDALHGLWHSTFPSLMSAGPMTGTPGTTRA